MNTSSVEGSTTASSSRQQIAVAPLQQLDIGPEVVVPSREVQQAVDADMGVVVSQVQHPVSNAVVDQVSPDVLTDNSLQSLSRELSTEIQHSDDRLSETSVPLPGPCDLQPSDVVRGETQHGTLADDRCDGAGPSCVGLVPMNAHGKRKYVISLEEWENVEDSTSRDHKDMDAACFLVLAIGFNKE
ncbi:hypothetical protein V6N13_017050 [Hibiscus sabdariffa]